MTTKEKMFSGYLPCEFRTAIQNAAEKIIFKHLDEYVDLLLDTFISNRGIDNVKDDL